MLLHGKLHWSVIPPSDDVCQPQGFYCHRYVLASNEQSAAEKAVDRVQSNLSRDGSWLNDGGAILSLEAEEIRAAPMHRLLKPDDRGHTFYEQD